MASIIANKCYQEYDDDGKVLLTIAFTFNTTPVSLKMHANPLYNEVIIDEISGWKVGDTWYTRIPSVRPSSWIGISLRDTGDWSSEHIFYALDDEGYPSTYYPPYIPFIRHQYARTDGNNYWEETSDCVAVALATMKEIHEYREGKGSHQYYSIGWIYGNRLSSDSQSEGMIYAQALERLKADGAPPYRLLPQNANYAYPDNYFYNSTYPRNITAKQLVSSNYSAVIDQARLQRIASYSSTTTHDMSIMKECIMEEGCILVSVDLYDNCYPNSTGIFPEYPQGSFHDGHMMPVIGWKKIDNKNYWICANGWGSWNGDNGLYYLPFFCSMGHTYWLVRDGQYEPPSGPPMTPSAPLLDSSYPNGGRLDGSVALQWGTSAGATQYKVKVRRGYDSYTQILNFTSASGIVYSLLYGVTYYISVAAVNSYGTSAYSSESTCTTAPQAPTISLGEVTATAITINVGALQGNYTKVRVYNQNTGAYLECSENSSVTFTGLAEGVTYTFDAQTRFYINGTTLWSANWSNAVTATASSSRPAYFAWDTPKTAGQPFQVSAVEWNRLVQNVKDMHAYKLGSYNASAYPMLSVGVDWPFFASRFNEVRFAIGSLVSTGLANKVRDDRIYASELNLLVSRLNSLN